MLTKTHIATTGNLILVPVVSYMVYNPYSFEVQKPVIDDTLPIILMYILMLLGSIFPDIDNNQTLLGKIFKPLTFWIPHRTITHCIYPIILLITLSIYFDSMYLFSFTMGYFLHIWEDSFSKMGIAWWRPFKGYIEYPNGAKVKRRRFLGKRKYVYKVGSRREKIFQSYMVAVNLFSMFLLILSYVK